MGAPPSRRTKKQLASVPEVENLYRWMTVSQVLDLDETLRGQGTIVRRRQAIVEENRRELLSRLVEDFACAMRSLGFARGEALELVRSAFEWIEAGEGVEE